MTTPEVMEISDSQLKNAQRCERRWAYEKLLKLSPLENMDNLVFGNACHKGMDTYIKTRDMTKVVIDVDALIVKGNPSNMPWQRVVVPSMVTGWAFHWLPKFEAEYEYISCEEWFSSDIHPEVRLRGYKDFRARKRTTGGIYVGDYKTSGSPGGGDLAKEVQTNNQLSRYAVSERRHYGVWPAEVGLVFLIKPKDEDATTAAMKARTKPELYFTRTVQVTPQFAQFALDVEASDVLYGQRLLSYRNAFKQHGPHAMDFVPPNFNNCTAYGTLCGFAAGCHGGCPAHKALVR